MIKNLILKNRSYRRFHQYHKIKMETLRGLVDLARLSASAKNMQPLKYILSCEPEKNSLINNCLGWAMYIPDWGGPVEGERPSAYIVILGDTTIRPKIDCDHGIAAQSIMLGAVDIGLGGCMISTIEREKLREALKIDNRYDILLVLALGKPKERVVVEPLPPDGDTKYWRDKDQVHHVPKRSLDEIIL